MLLQLSALNTEQIASVLSAEIPQGEREGIVLQGQNSFINRIVGSYQAEELKRAIGLHSEAQKEFKKKRIIKPNKQLYFILSLVWDKNKNMFLECNKKEFLKSA